METKNIDLGVLFGFRLTLNDVPIERYEHVKKLSIAHLDRLNKLYEKNIFGEVKIDLEVAKLIGNK